MKRKTVAPSIGNVLHLFARELDKFKGESKRSYKKAFSSFQVYLVSNYLPEEIFDTRILENWVIFNITRGMTLKTVYFYLEKISSLYSGTAYKLDTGKTSIFKDLKRRLKEWERKRVILPEINEIYTLTYDLWNSGFKKDTPPAERLDLILSEMPYSYNTTFCALAFKTGLQADRIKNCLDSNSASPEILELSSEESSSSGKQDIRNRILNSLFEEEMHWFALRLRPKIKFEGLLTRFSDISSQIKIPEIFYPYEEIIKKIGKKIIFTGKPVIRDIIFFKMKRTEVSSMMSHLYDIAWCYKRPGTFNPEFAVIPSRAMDDFKRALGFLNSDFEVAPAGTMKLKKGDEVVVLCGDYADHHATVQKIEEDRESGNKIYRLSLLNCNGRWDIGIDARLVKKVEKLGNEP